MKRFPIKRLLAGAVLAALGGAAGSAHAINVMQAYQAALENDPTYKSAIFENRAGQENRIIGRSQLLPQASISANLSKNKSDIDRIDPKTGTVFPTEQVDYTSKGVYLQVKQPLINFDAWARYKQGVAQTNYSDAVFGTRKQELVMRVVSAYVEAQFAEEALALATAQRDALAEQRNVNNRMFEKGESAKTDVLETQAKYDAAQAQVIEAADAVTTARNTLSSVTGLEVTSVDALTSEFRARPLEPSGFTVWKDNALATNSELEALRQAVEIARQEVNKARAGHAPRLDLVGTISRSDSESINTLNSDYRTKSIGVQLNIPLYSGGYVSATSRQAAANYEKAKTDLEAKTNQVVVELRKQYDLVQSGVTRMEAQEKSVGSSTLLVEATRQSIKGGVRINLDLLNAQQQLYQARRDLAQSRYNYLLAYLRLHGAAGNLGGQQLQAISGYFVAK